MSNPRRLLFTHPGRARTPFVSQQAYGSDAAFWGVTIVSLGLAIYHKPLEHKMFRLFMPCVAVSLGALRPPAEKFVGRGCLPGEALIGPRGGQGCETHAQAYQAMVGETVPPSGLSPRIISHASANPQQILPGPPGMALATGWYESPSCPPGSKCPGAYGSTSARDHHLLQWWDSAAKQNLSERVDGDLVAAVFRARQIDERLEHFRSSGMGRAEDAARRARRAVQG